METDKNVEVIRSGSEVIVNVHSQNADDSDGETEERFEENPREENHKRNFLQSRYISESSGDELASSVGSSIGSGRYKSILKSRTFSRSISESSIDSAAQFSCITFNDMVHEFNSESEGSSFKKTVRFNDVISQKLYRSVSMFFFLNIMSIKFKNAMRFY